MNNNKTNSGISWINPLGGMGDTLMVSGVLKLVIENDPLQRFNLIRRTSYLSILKGHPAIAEIGYPPQDATIIGTDYWSKEELGPNNQRAFQILARMFGLPSPIEEHLYLCDGLEEDPLLHNFIPWGKQNILIAPFSACPRKEMHPSLWHHLVDLLHQKENFVVQVGKLHEQHIRNTYSLLGLTTPQQLIALIRKFDVVVTSDNFIMHAAHLVGTPTVVLWGPTDHRVYGYAEQTHLQSPKMCNSEVECIGPQKGHLYQTPCPLESRHCMGQITPEDIYKAVQGCLEKGTASILF